MQQFANEIMPNVFFNIESLTEYTKKVKNCLKCGGKSQIIIMDFVGLLPPETKETDFLKINRIKSFRNSREMGVRVITQCPCGLREYEESQQQKQLKKIELMKKESGVPSIFKDSKMSDFEDREGTYAIKSISEAFIKEFEGYRKNGDGLYFHSLTSGNGKSFICSIIANELIEQGYKVKFVATQAMLLDIRETFHSDSKTSEREYLNNLCNNDLIIFDDFGLELEKNKTDWIVNELSLIFNKLYETKKPFVITSNLSFDELLEKLGEKRRIVSRILERCTFIENEASDYRQEKAIARLK